MYFEHEVQFCFEHMSFLGVCSWIHTKAHAAFEYGCPIEMSNQIRHVYMILAQFRHGEFPCVKNTFQIDYTDLHMSPKLDMSANLELFWLTQLLWMDPPIHFQLIPILDMWILSDNLNVHLSTCGETSNIVSQIQNHKWYHKFNWWMMQEYHNIYSNTIINMYACANIIIKSHQTTQTCCNL